MLERKLKTMEEAARLIRDGDTVFVNGLGIIASGGSIFREVERTFLSDGHPRNLTFCSCCGMGYEIEGYNYSEYLAHPGLLKRVVVGHWSVYRPLVGMVERNEIEAYNIPQGILSILLNEAVARKPGYVSKVGLHSAADPRHGGGALNTISSEKLVESIQLFGEEYLYYKTLFPDVCVIQGTSADPRGNISFDNEIVINDALAMAQATRNNGGRVIALVRDLRTDFGNAQMVRVPGFLVDAVVVNPGYVQCWPGLPENDSFCGKVRFSPEVIDEAQKEFFDASGREASHKFIGRRAALELREGNVVNLGIGIPMMVATEGRAMGTLDESVTLTIETGTCGGFPVPSLFGVTMNADAIYDQASQFRFYEGGGLDTGFLGALEVDRHGNVNVGRKGDMIAGLGGFNFIAFSAKKIVFCLKFQNGSGFRRAGDGGWVPVNGKPGKFVEKVESYSMDAAYHRSLGKRIIYVTERCVFELDDDGLVLVEIAPGLDPRRDVLDHMPFPVRVSGALKSMPDVCFQA